MAKFFRGVTTRALSDVGCDRNCCSPDLRRQSKPLFLGKPLSFFVDSHDEINRGLPDFESFVGAHRSFFSYHLSPVTYHPSYPAIRNPTWPNRAQHIRTSMNAVWRHWDTNPSHRVFSSNASWGPSAASPAARRATVVPLAPESDSVVADRLCGSLRPATQRTSGPTIRWHSRRSACTKCRER